MVTPKCYIVSTEDRKIASLFVKNGYRKMTAGKIASLRGLYDKNQDELAEKTGNDPDYLLSDNMSDNDILEAYNKLVQFRVVRSRQTHSTVSKGTKRVDRAYDVLRHVYNGAQRKSRVSLISSLFSEEVDRLVSKHQVSRQMVANGFRTITGEFVAGESAILNSVYDKLLKERQRYYTFMQDANVLHYYEVAKRAGLLNYANAPQNYGEFQDMCKKRYEEYTKMLECWDELLPFALKDLVKTEGIKLGVKKEFASVASSDSYGDNDIASKWEMSEAKRDGWMENSDLQSAFGSVGQQVRRVLATVPEVEVIPMYKEEKAADGSTKMVFDRFETKIVLDDIGNPTFKDPTKTHQQLMEFLNGCKNSKDMMQRLCSDSDYKIAKIPWMQPIVNILNKNPQVKTQFFVDFKKNFQPFSEMWEDKDRSQGLVKCIKTRLLNRPINVLKNKYKLAPSSMNAKRWKIEPVFNDDARRGRGATVNWQRLAELHKTVREWVVEKEQEVEDVTIFGELERYGVSTALLTDRSRNATKDYDAKRQFLTEVFAALGIDVEMDTIDSILHSNAIYGVREQLEMIFDKGQSGILYALEGQTSSDFKDLRTGSKEKKAQALEKLNNAKITWKSIINTPKKNAEGKKFKPVEEHIDKLLDIINDHQEGKRIESRTRYQGNTLFSHVAPSYLGDRLETIQSYVKENDKIGLYNFLKEEYLCSPFFVDDRWLVTDGKEGHILNTWLQAMVDACKDTKTPLADSVVSIFTYERDLGREDKKFEDFTSKEHGIDMFIHFFADENQNKGYGGKGKRNVNKKASAMYPIFILGDAGVSKYIRAPRFTTPTRIDKNGNVIDTDAGTHHIEYRFDDEAKANMLEAFWDIYQQERRRMQIDDAIAKTQHPAYYANGKEISEKDHPKGSFTFLTFLNTEEYAIPENLKDDKVAVKSIIRQYLEDASLNGMTQKQGTRTVKIPSFKSRMEQLGILDTAEIYEGRKKVNAFQYLSTVATPENIDSKVEEFFWNTTLATAQQLQLMTIDPEFYHGTKDLQKRYKEIHAPGSILDTEAVDFDGEKYSADGIERVAYFDDLKVNAENFNRSFMETVLRTFATPEALEIDANTGLSKVEMAIQNGICIPLEDKALDTARRNQIRDFLGENAEIYDAYTENTLTDGQGYRSLTSYRRVKGMAGQWTKDMDDAYKEIMDIRSKHAVWENGKIVDYTEATPEELQKIRHLAIVLQPIKPYMFTHEKREIEIEVYDEQLRGNKKIKTTQLVPVQHKYAEALIIPELMPKGHMLRDLGFWMDENNVDVVGSTKIVKTGCFGQTDLKGIKDKSGLYDAMSQAVVHQLPYRDYRIQTNVPEHINSSQLFGTQIRKLIMAGLNMQEAGEYYKMYLLGQEGFEGTVNLSTDGNKTNANASLNGRNLLALYNSLICANIFDSYDKFAQNAGDIEALSDLLQQSTVSSMREAMDNLFAYVVTGNDEDLQRFMIPLFEGGLEHDAAALILSTFKKIVNKQQISGGSAVQVSALGIKGYSEDGDLRFVTDPDNNANILYAEIEMPFDRSYFIDIKGPDGKIVKQKVNLQYDKYCNPDGTLIPTGEEIEKGTAEWKKYQSYTYKEVDGKLVVCDYNDPEAKVYKPLIEEEYPDILSILAYRIPTERDYSMINCRIKRFTSKTAGGTIKVPAQGTTIAGFDFDIDKLYFMQREYHREYKREAINERNYSDSAKNKVWTAFYRDNQDVYDALVLAREKAAENDPSIYHEEKVFRRGRDTGRTKRVYDVPLNKFWKEANISLDKGEAFRETAHKEGIMPDIIVKTEDVYKRGEVYDFSKTPEQNSRAARNNLLISLIQARLMDPQTMKQRYTPGGFTNAKKSARFMRELMHGDLDKAINADGTVNFKELKARKGSDTDPEPNYDPLDPYTMLIYNQQNQVASKLIGIFANQNTNHAFASVMHKFQLKEPIEFCGHSFKDLLHKNPEDAAKIDLTVAEFLAASVDAVKDPVLNFMNLNTITADAGAMLARLGYSTDEIGLLFNQPIIRKICEDSFNRGVLADTAIDDARNILLTHTKTDVSKIQLTANDLAIGIIGERRAKENGATQDDYINSNATMQLAALELFSKVLSASKDVSDFVLNTKFTAANAVKSTLGGMYAQQLKVDAYVDRFPKSDKDKGSLSYEIEVVPGKTGLFDKPITNDPRYLTMSKEEYLHEVRFNPFAYEQAMYDTNRKALRLLCGDKTSSNIAKRRGYFPYETEMYTRARARLAGLCRIGTLNEDDINDIHSNIPVALLAKQEGSLFDGEAVHVDANGVPMNLTNREYYRERFARDLSEILATNPELNDLPIFDYLYPVPDTQTVPDPNRIGDTIEKQTWRISMQDVGGMDSDIKDEIRDSWASLMVVKDNGEFVNPQYAAIGRDLFIYCFYQLGFEFSPISFMHLAPVAVKDNIRIRRPNNRDIEYFNDMPTPEKYPDAVLVWSENVDGAHELADRFGADYSVMNELSQNSYQLSEKLSVEDFRKLCIEARSHPELTFKIFRDLSQDEIDLLREENLKMDVPDNIEITFDSYQNASPESKEAISYGREFSYRQFLNDILDEKESSLNEDEYAQMFILNHLDNSKFVMDVNRTNKELKKIIEQEIADSPQENSFTIDLSKYNDKKRSEAIADLASKEERNGVVASVEWCPCIKVGDFYYMPKHNGDTYFNVTKTSMVTYVKVTPWGTTKSISYDGEVIKPSLRYQTSIEAEPQRNNDYQEPVALEEPAGRSNLRNNSVFDKNFSELTRDEWENEIIKAYVTAWNKYVATSEEGKIFSEGIEQMKRDMAEKSGSDIRNEIARIKAACKDGENVIMMDADGNFLQGC